MELPNDIASCHRIILELVSVLEDIKPQLAVYIQQIEAQREQIEAQRGQIAHLEFHVKELESQTKQNSRNSSRPPSSDMYRQKPAFPRAKGGKVGGKEGHDGGTLEMVPDPDHIVEHREKVCAHCGKVHFQEPLSVRGRRQVFDIPPPRIEVTEHRVLDWVCCGCHHENQGKFPIEVSGPTQYGFRLQTTSVLFNNAYSIPPEQSTVDLQRPIRRKPEPGNAPDPTRVCLRSIRRGRGAYQGSTAQKRSGALR